MKKINYILANGETIIIDDFTRRDDNLFKVNLPDSEESFKTGNGEGIWCCADDETVKALGTEECDSRKNGKVYLVKALNDSIYYMGLVEYGDVIAVEARGTSRPVAILDELKDMCERDNKVIIKGSVRLFRD